MTTENITTCAVVGSGYMGGGIAQVMALAGLTVNLVDQDVETALRSHERLVNQAELLEKDGLFPLGATEKIGTNIVAAASLEAAVSDVEYITEAVPEILEVKLATLAAISAAARPDTIIGTNTSAIPIETLAQVVSRPERFLGVHWMNPAPFIPGVEIIAATMTSPEAVTAAEVLMSRLGKIATRVSDTPGFVANRLQFALYREAVDMLETGVATAEQIDAVVSSTFGFRLALFGPIAIGDMAGLDVYDGAYTTLAQAYGEKFMAPALMVQAVQAGNLGVKTGKGLRGIDPADVPGLVAYRERAYAELSALRTKLGSAPGL
jgi:3-hydroxybutyryl-CoA dehydrogenase